MQHALVAHEAQQAQPAPEVQDAHEAQQAHEAQLAHDVAQHAQDAHEAQWQQPSNRRRGARKARPDSDDVVMDEASASAAAEALKATLKADLVGLRAQLSTGVLDADGQQDGHPDVVVVRDVGEVEDVLSADVIRARPATEA